MRHPHDAKAGMNRPGSQMTKYCVLAATIAVAVALIAGILFGLLALFQLGVDQLHSPILAWDSWEYTRAPQSNRFDWLLSQHNEHRIVWARLASIFETDLAGIPPASSALLQSFLLTVTSIILLFFICKDNSLKPLSYILPWLSCSIVLLNPWQIENFGWEFQTPWILTNTLVLCSSLLISRSSTCGGSRVYLLLIASIIPWLSIFNTGQGLAVSASLCIAAAMTKRSLFITSTISTLLALIFYIKVLPYNKPAHHPGYGFNLAYFMDLIKGGPWIGAGFLSIACLLLIFVVSLNRRHDLKQYIWTDKKFTALALPAIFAILYTIMVTLSRSEFGIAQASSSRYLTHTLMLPISLILIASHLLSQNKNDCIEHTSRLASIQLVIPALSMIAVMTPPRYLLSNKVAPSFPVGWAAVKQNMGVGRSIFKCLATKHMIDKLGMNSSEPCASNLYPEPSLSSQYFSGDLPVKPAGWHRQLSKLTINPSAARTGTYVHGIDLQKKRDGFLDFAGWAFEYRDPAKIIFVVAKYSSGKEVVYAVNLLRPDVLKVHPNVPRETGFDLSVPIREGSTSLQQLLISGAKGSEVIWSSAKVQNF